MNKRRIVTIMVCVLVIVLIGLCVLIPVFQLYKNVSIYIFEDISECEAIESLNAEGGHFTKYQDTKKDDKLDNLQYAEFFAGKYFCDQYTFEIFAYVFDDSALAKTYFENATGKKSDTLDTNFSMVSGLTTSHIVVFKENKVYAVYCSNDDLADVTAVLADSFTTKIK